MYIQNISCLGMVSGFVEVGTPHIHFGQKDKGLRLIEATKRKGRTLSGPATETMDDSFVVMNSLGLT